MAHDLDAEDERRAAYMYMLPPFLRTVPKPDAMVDDEDRAVLARVYPLGMVPTPGGCCLAGMMMMGVT